MRWYVIKAVSGRENHCREQIAIQLKVRKLVGFVGQMLIPAERVTEVKRGKKVTTERKLYPGYIYIEMELNNDVLEASMASMASRASWVLIPAIRIP